MDSNENQKRLKEIDEELEKIGDAFKEYHSYKDKKTGIYWLPPGKTFNYQKMVDREQELLKERKSIVTQMGGA